MQRDGFGPAPIFSFFVLENEAEGLISPVRLGELWRNFRTRWGHYWPFAPCLPFYPLFAELEEISKKVDVFFHTGAADVDLFVQYNVAAHTRRIKSILEECSAYVS